MNTARNTQMVEQIVDKSTIRYDGLLQVSILDGRDFKGADSSLLLINYYLLF